MRSFILIMVLYFLFMYLPPAVAKDPLLLYYFERAPYAVASNQGKITGLVATPAEMAFNEAGISFQWKRMPFKRQLQTIKYNKKIACGIGWFKNAEREAFARFTDPIYQDKPAVIISKKDNKTIGGHKDLKSLFKDKNIKLLVKDSFSYGSHIDELIRNYKPEIVSVVNSTNVQMLRMVLSGRADYFIISNEEAEHIILSAGYEIGQFQLHSYSDIPAGNYRYIACSQQVPEDIIDLINKALK